MSTTTTPVPAAPTRAGSRPPTPIAASARPAIELTDVEARAGSRRILDRITLALPAGSLVAIAGPSGSGKTTLIEIMAGVRAPSAGTVALDGGRVGFVPQDDIIHLHLPLRRTLLHAARLRLPDHERRRAPAIVSAVLEQLGLADVADVPVVALSGGQRKRASIAVELLTTPDVLFLDEPTSGLDPLRAVELIDALRGLVEQGLTVVLTTHQPVEIDRCDEVVLLTTTGRVAHAGPPAHARQRYGITDIVAVYRHLEEHRGSGAPPPASPAASTATSPPVSSPVSSLASDRRSPAATRRGETMAASPLRQWVVLSGRAAEVMARNRLTAAIVVGSPVLVVVMMTILFPAGAGARSATDPTSALPVAFWMAFCAFFFGLTYGLLQVVTERSVLRRERFAGLRLVPYLASKVAVLVPLLVAVDAALLAVLGLFDRLPPPSAVSYPALLATLVLTAAVGLLVGLAASAAVGDPTQATLALPMICFPQVLFAGAVVAVAEMTAVGDGISVAMATRWSFQSLGRTLMGAGPGRGGPVSGDVLVGSPVAEWGALGVIGVIAALTAVAVLARRTAPVRHRSR